jgi:hypothetical protein
VVCRPEHVDTWGQVDPATLRLLFAEHGLKLQIDGASPWSQVSLLWIEPRPTVGAA